MESMGGVTKMWRPFRPERDIGRADSTCTHGQCFLLRKMGSVLRYFRRSNNFLDVS